MSPAITLSVWVAYIPHVCSCVHTELSRFRLPNAWAPTLVGTKLLCPNPPDRLRKSAKRWVTQVAVLHALFCAVALLVRMEKIVKTDQTSTGLKMPWVTFCNNFVCIIDSHTYLLICFTKQCMILIKKLFLEKIMMRTTDVKLSLTS